MGMGVEWRQMSECGCVTLQNRVGVVLPCRVEWVVVGVEWSGKGLGYDNG